MNNTVHIGNQSVTRPELYVLATLVSFSGYAKVAEVWQRLVVPMERPICLRKLDTLRAKGLVRSRSSGTMSQEWAAGSYARDYFAAHPFTLTEEEKSLITSLLTSPYRLSVSGMVVDGAYTQLLIALALYDNWIRATMLAEKTGYTPKSVAHRLTHLYEIDLVDAQYREGAPTLYSLNKCVRAYFEENPHYLNLPYVSREGA